MPVPTTKELRVLEGLRPFFQNLAEGTFRMKNESLEARHKRIAQLKSDYAAFCAYYFPHYCHAESADFHIEAANAVRNNPHFRGSFQWFRGAAKSTNLVIMTPLWLLANNEFHTMILCGRNLEAAETLLADLAFELKENDRFIHDYGRQFNRATWATDKFITLDGKAFFAFGKAQNPRGTRNRASRPDLLVGDDLDDDQEVRNPERVKKAVEKLETAFLGTMEMGRGRAYFLGNRIADDCIIEHFANKEGWFTSKVNALNDAGESTWPANYSTAEIVQRINEAGSRLGGQEYMNRPPTDGRIFPEELIVWGPMPAWDQFDVTLLYIDPAFKVEANKGDYKAVVLVSRIGKTFYVQRAYVRRGDRYEMVKWVYRLYDELRSKVRILFYAEADGNQKRVANSWFLDEARAAGREPLPISDDERRKPKKTSRIQNMGWYFSMKRVVFDETQRNEIGMMELVRQLTIFDPTNPRLPDDGPDALEGAFYLAERRSNAPVVRAIKRERFR